MREMINLTNEDPRYEEVVCFAEKRSDENLIIVARNAINRKNDVIPPLEVKNGIYFYLANDVGGALVYPERYTHEQVEKAKENTIRNVRLGGLFDVMLGEGVEFSDWELDDVMSVLTNKTKSNGAGILYCTDFIRQIFDKIGDFYILPSSIHEVIIVQKGSVDLGLDGLSQMVREINASTVAEDERLADEGYEAEAWM